MIEEKEKTYWNQYFNGISDAWCFVKLMEFSNGKIIMALEGWYNLNSLANSVLACVEVLLEGKPIAESLEVYPFESTWRVIKAVDL